MQDRYYDPPQIESETLAKRVRFGLILFAVFVMGIMAAKIGAAEAASQPAVYTKYANTRLNQKHCKSEDSFMFIASRRVMDGVYYPRDARRPVLCVHIDYVYRAVSDD